MIDSFEVDTQRIVAALPDKQRQAVCLVYGAGYSQAEAAQQMGLCQKTISNILADACAAIRLYLTR